MPFSLLLLLRAELCLPCCFLYSVENMPQASRSTSPFCVNIAVLPHWTSDGFMTCFNLQKFCKDYNSIMKPHVANPVCLLRTTKKSTQREMLNDHQLHTCEWWGCFLLLKISLELSPNVAVVILTRECPILPSRGIKWNSKRRG